MEENHVESSNQQNTGDFCHISTEINPTDFDLPEVRVGKCPQTGNEQSCNNKAGDPEDHARNSVNVNSSDGRKSSIQQGPGPEGERKSSLGGGSRQSSFQQDPRGSKAPQKSTPTGLKTLYIAPPFFIPKDVYQPPKNLGGKGQGHGQDQGDTHRSDYPGDLKMTRECIPRPQKEYRTTDNYQSQPVAYFSPIASMERLGLTDEEIEEKRKSSHQHHPPCQKERRDAPPISSIADEAVVNYLQDHNLQMLFEYFMALSILNQPAKPLEYIADLAGKLMRGRNSKKEFEDVPRLLSKTHVEAMFRLYDRVGTGFMSFLQYKNAMTSMGLMKYNLEPEGYQLDEITKEAFVKEATEGVDELLKSFMFERKNKSC